jgi:rod shape-determining protein MreC
MRPQDFRSDRTLPLVITLIVISVLVMTFDIRSRGEGVIESFRVGVNRLLGPLERLGSMVVDPLADFVDGLADITDLRAENESLRARLAESQAELAAVGDLLDRLESLEQLLDLQLAVTAFRQTPANVIGRTSGLDLSFRIDKGEESGVLPGQPVLDPNGYLVGRVLDSWQGGASIIPLVGDVDAVTVTVGDQVGTLSAVLGSETLILDVFETARPVRAGDRVVTSSFSAAFPPSIPVGEIVADADPRGQALTALVRPFAQPQRLRAVVVVAWPPDPGASGDSPGGAGPGPTIPGSSG